MTDSVCVLLQCSPSLEVISAEVKQSLVITGQTLWEDHLIYVGQWRTRFVSEGVEMKAGIVRQGI